MRTKLALFLILALLAPPAYADTLGSSKFGSAEEVGGNIFLNSSSGQSVWVSGLFSRNEYNKLTVSLSDIDGVLTVKTQVLDSEMVIRDRERISLNDEGNHNYYIPGNEKHHTRRIVLEVVNGSAQVTNIEVSKDRKLGAKITIYALLFAASVLLSMKSYQYLDGGKD